jgi:hypothetical protein
MIQLRADSGETHEFLIPLHLQRKLKGSENHHSSSLVLTPLLPSNEEVRDSG